MSFNAAACAWASMIGSVMPGVGAVMESSARASAGKSAIASAIVSAAKRR
jgi:hypothetical protein